VLLLMANGGYDPDKTATEFSAPYAAAAYRRRLYDPAATDAAAVARYYSTGNYGNLLADGTLALVNAVAYRSPRLSDERHNQELVPHLLSVQAHREWLIKEVIPEAKAGRRLIVAHRWGNWDIDSFRDAPWLIRSLNPASQHLSKDVRLKIDRFVQRLVRVDDSGRSAP
jgi:hypothetical protein